MIRLLLNYKVPANTCDNQGFTPIFLTIYNFDDVTIIGKIITELLNAGVDINQSVSISVKTLRKYWEDLPRVYRYLFPHDTFNITPLHAAVLGDKAEVVSLLLSMGAQNKPDSLGITPIDLAVKSDNTEILKIFDDFGIESTPLKLKTSGDISGLNMFNEKSKKRNHQEMDDKCEAVQGEDKKRRV